VGVPNLAGIRLTILAFLFVSAAACSKSGEPDKSNPGPAVGSLPADDGGWDGGGGETQKSTPELVRKVIALAQKNAGEKEFDRNVFKQFLRFSMTEDVEMLTDLLFPVLEVDGRPKQTGASPTLDAISKKILVIKDGDCPKPKGRVHVDASVTSHTLDGEMCFDLKSLAETSPADLTRQIMGIVFHEAAHLGGANEEQAVLLQNSFLGYFSRRFTDMNVESYLVNTGTSLTASMISIVGMQNVINQNMDVDVPLLYSTMGRVYGQVSSLWGLGNATDLSLRLQIEYPSANRVALAHAKLLNLIDANFHAYKMRVVGLAPSLDYLKPRSLMILS